MKTFTRVLMAVAALFAFSCTTDVTEDLGVQLGEGQTAITLSLEASRTQLGEKAGEVYPLLWSEGDKISVNGVESGEAVIDGANGAVASFAVSASTPYCIAYPAAPTGQVLFAEKQAYTSNTTFGSGVATMYGYSEDGLGVQLNHLTGVLKIGVVGSAKLAMAQISTVDRAPIAGAFELDFATGEATATKSAKEVIEYSFGEGVQLSSEPTYIHVAVPAGVYDELYVTLYDVEGGVMYATVKANNEKPLAVGKVREFSSNIPYAATDKVFVVKDVATLKAFAESAATLEKDVLFVADVDMTGEAWTPIEGYAKTVRGNGYAIKGMTAPLFGVTSASIKGLHLRDVNINETVTPNVGAFARQITASATARPSIEHCSVSGKIVVNCADYAYKSVAQYHEFTVGGLVGTLFGVSANNCSSSAEIDIVQCVAQSNTKEIRPGVGGVFGSIASFSGDGVTAYAPVLNCSNSGDIKIGNGAYNGTTDYVHLSVGGVIGITFKDNVSAKIEYLNNSGDITIDANFTKYDSRIGGVIGWSYSENLAHLVNSGAVTYNSGKFYYIYMAGVVGYAATAAPVIDAVNKGAVTVKKEAVQLASLVVGGLVGHHQEDSSSSATKDNDVIKDSVNEGIVSIEANIPENTGTCYFRVGGVCGWSQNAVVNTTNKGAVNISGSLYNAQTNAHSIAVGGVVGYHTVTGSTNVTNEGNITSTANVGYAADDDGDNCRMWIGGVEGYSSASTNAEIYNKGKISVSGSHYCLYVGGLFGYVASSLTTGENSGSITIEPNTTMDSYFMVGGACAWFNNSLTDVKNSGTVTVSEGVSAVRNTYFSGCAAYSETSTSGVVAQRLSNEGSVLVNGTYSAKIYLAGCLAYWNENSDKQYLRGADNYGPLTANVVCNGSEMCAGGVVGYMRCNGSRGLHNHKSGTITLDVTTTAGKIAVGGIAYGLRHQLSAAVEGESVNGNDADIILTGSSATTFDVGGIICVPNNYHRYDAYNKGNITITGAEVGTDLRVGGSEANHNYGKTVLNYYNAGNITVDATTKVQGSVYIGGLSGGESLLLYDTAPHNFENCYNSGNIKFSGEAGLSGTGVVKMGGALACFVDTDSHDPTLTFTNGFTNSGSVTFNGVLHSEGGEVYMGGLIGELTLGTKDCSSWSGDIVVSGNVLCNGTCKGKYHVGGVIGETNKSFANGVVFGNLEVMDEQGAGMLTATPRSESIVVSNFKVGGCVRIFNALDEGYVTTSLNADNFYNYLYGGSTDWTGAPDYDGCTYISALPAVTTAE